MLSYILITCVLKIMLKINQNQISKIKFILRYAKDNYNIVLITINDYLLNENNIFELFSYTDRIGLLVDIRLNNGTKPILEYKSDMVNSYFMLNLFRNMFTNRYRRYKENTLTNVNSENMLCHVNSNK